VSPATGWLGTLLRIATLFHRTDPRPEGLTPAASPPAHATSAHGRYIRIITEGLRHFGAEPAWVARVAAQPCNPPRPRAEWLRVPEVPHTPGCPLPAFTLKQLEAGRGRLPAVYAIGRKVVRADVDDESHPFAPILKLMAGSQVCGLVEESPLRPPRVGWRSAAARTPLCRWRETALGPASVPTGPALNPPPPPRLLC
jgi:hypothetical protein